MVMRVEMSGQYTGVDYPLNLRAQLGFHGTNKISVPVEQLPPAKQISIR